MILLFPTLIDFNKIPSADDGDANGERGEEEVQRLRDGFYPEYASSSIHPGYQLCISFSLSNKRQSMLTTMSNLVATFSTAIARWTSPMGSPNGKGWMEQTAYYATRWHEHGVGTVCVPWIPADQSDLHSAYQSILSCRSIH